MYDGDFIIYENKIGSLRATINNQREKLERSLAPVFYGEALDADSVENMFKTIDEGDEITLFVPSAKQYVKAHIMDSPDYLSDGCDASIDYTTYDLDFNEVDGGQMDFNRYSSHYVDDIRRAAGDIVRFAFGDEVTFIPLATA